MDVFLVPVASDRYELYCEEPEQPAATEDVEPPTGLLRRMTHAFKQQLAEAEHERRKGPDPSPGRKSLFARAKSRLLRWVAESIAEQRLLWQLRGRDCATLVHPDDISNDAAQQWLRKSLQRDWERHRFWLVIDTLGGLGSILLILLPGPNFIGYYFMFRIVGHYFSLRGARQGLTATVWTLSASQPLTTLRTIVSDPPESREAVVREVETTLRLEHLAAFFQRAAVE